MQIRWRRERETHVMSMDVLLAGGIGVPFMKWKFMKQLSSH
jgi:hypothetical protein